MKSPSMVLDPDPKKRPEERAGRLIFRTLTRFDLDRIGTTHARRRRFDS